MHWATNGLCDNNCNYFTAYIVLIAAGNMIASTSRTGDTLLTLRFNQFSLHSLLFDISNYDKFY